MENAFLLNTYILKLLKELNNITNGDGVEWGRGRGQSAQKC